MKASKKKSATMSIAITLIGGGITAIANAKYYPGGTMLAAGLAFMLLYEFYNVEQIRGTDPEDVHSATRALAKFIKKTVGGLRSKKSQ